jgi:hypothetical protein
MFWATFPVISIFALERRVFEENNRRGIILCFSYFVSKLMVVPFQISVPWTGGTNGYWLVGLNPLPDRYAIAMVFHCFGLDM